MTARKTNTSKTPDPNAELLASVIAAPKSADIARLLGVNGKTLRNYVRHTLGVYVNGGHDGARTSLTDDDKRAVWAKFGPADAS
jgi:hypothetical protein